MADTGWKRDVSQGFSPVAYVRRIDSGTARVYFHEGLQLWAWSVMLPGGCGAASGAESERQAKGEATRELRKRLAAKHAVAQDAAEAQALQARKAELFDRIMLHGRIMGTGTGRVCFYLRCPDDTHIAPGPVTLVTLAEALPEEGMVGA